MKPFAALCAVVIPGGSAVAGDREFAAIVHRVDARYDTSHSPIPFFGLANVVVKVMRPAGASEPAAPQRVDCIYAGGSGNRWKLLVTAMEWREATLLRIKRNPNGLMRWIAQPPERARNWQHD